VKQQASAILWFDMVRIESEVINRDSSFGESHLSVSENRIAVR
jgi:hypothetical protein